MKNAFLKQTKKKDAMSIQESTQKLVIFSVTNSTHYRHSGLFNSFFRLNKKTVKSIFSKNYCCITDDDEKHQLAKETNRKKKFN